jgi:N-sulfoglucosamine sulfohydrolase
MRRPNLLYLHSHDTGRWIQPYGCAVPTPNLQHLAEEGVLFRQAFCANPTCSPSRAALLTGQCAHSSGMLGLAHRGFHLADYSQHLVHTLRRAGYFSALAGVQHLANDFPQSWQTIGYDADLMALASEPDLKDPANAHLRAARFLDQNPPQPFFLSVGFYETHRPFAEKDLNRDPQSGWVGPPPGLPDAPQTRLDMAGFVHSAKMLDRKMGVVLDALERSHLAENTLVICTTDHGPAFPTMKCTLKDSGTGVFLILRGPDGWRGGKIIDVMVSHPDLFPTLCEMLEIDPPDWLQGESLLPLLNGRQDEIHTALFTEVNYHASYEPQRAVRTPRWKYIRRYDGRSRPVLPDIDAGLSKSYLLARGLAEQPVEAEALYDLVYDPLETCNLASDPSQQPTLDQMRARLQGWMQATQDPLLAGDFIEPPPGARINDPDGLDPVDRDYIAIDDLRQRFSA